MSLTPAFIIAILTALTVHEWAHAWVAYQLGDPTAKYEGRVTLNPIAHLDPLGTLMFVIVGFGWGKPVPADPRYFNAHTRKRDMALVALAGPASNFVIAVGVVLVSAVLNQLSVSGSVLFVTFVNDLLSSMLFINLGLMAFNLLPVAPLDGSKIIAMFVPVRYEYEYQQYLQNGPYILIALLIAERVLGIPLIVWWIQTIIDPLLRIASAIL